mmetsp:Transcript_9796/g.14920  ORF Transcript_9796/g.14920 Transcript_9796/m.14920 type:complete len:295 (+) Transcript_9796:52-936(+)
MCSREALSAVYPCNARKIFSDGKYKSSTNGCCQGYLQCNVLILERQYATQFEQFCALNPRPVPLLEVLPAGDAFTSVLADNADIRHCLPQYRVYRTNEDTKKIEVHECHDIEQYWNDDMCTFLIGCSFSFERALQEQGIKMRHIELDRNVPMYDTNIDTNNNNVFGRHMVVSMRPIKRSQIQSTYQVTEAFASAHGSPIHFGNSHLIGIKDLSKPDYGETVPIKDNELPCFWPCGVTSHVAVQQALKAGIIKQAITHAPGCMFISDLKIEQAVKLKADAFDPEPIVVKSLKCKL